MIDAGKLDELEARAADPDAEAPTREEFAALLRMARAAGDYRRALERIVETDTHGKSTKDFCARCNHNSNWPHSDDCPITQGRAALDAGRKK